MSWRWIAAACCCVWLTGCDSGPNESTAVPAAAPPPGMAPAPPPIKAAGETLLLQPPPAWLRIAEQVQPKLRYAQFMPAGQSDDDWRDRMTVESNSLQPLPDPIEFLTALGDDLRRTCTESDHRNVHSGEENGYPTSVRMLMCKRDKATGRGRVSLVKAIRGNDWFYVISRTRRSDILNTDVAPLSGEEIGSLSLYLRSVRVCDAADPAHPCPQPQ